MNARETAKGKVGEYECLFTNGYNWNNPYNVLMVYGLYAVVME